MPVASKIHSFNQLGLSVGLLQVRIVKPGAPGFLKSLSLHECMCIFVYVCVCTPSRP